MLLNCGVGEDSWESLVLQGDPINPSWRRSVLGVHWKDWCWSWSSNTLATSCEELTHWKRPWCWEGLEARWEGDDRGWDGWMASPTWRAWVWVNCGNLRWTGSPGVLWSMGSQRVGHDWMSELNLTELKFWELVMEGKPGILQSMGSQRVRHDWSTELNWTEPRYLGIFLLLFGVWGLLQLFSRYSVRTDPFVDVFVICLWETWTPYPPNPLPSWLIPSLLLS